MRGLLRKGTAWVWTPDHKKEFVAVKKLLTSAPVAHYFDLQLESKLLTEGVDKCRRCAKMQRCAKMRLRHVVIIIATNCKKNDVQRCGCATS